MSTYSQSGFRSGVECIAAVLCLATAPSGCLGDSKQARQHLETTEVGLLRGSTKSRPAPRHASEDLSVFILRRAGLDSARIGDRELFDRGDPPVWPQFAVRPNERGAALVATYRTWYPIKTAIYAGRPEALTAAVLARTWAHSALGGFAPEPSGCTADVCAQGARKHGLAPSRQHAPRVVPSLHPRQLQATAAPVCRAGAQTLCSLWRPAMGLFKAFVSTVRQGLARRSLLPRSSDLSELRRQAHGRHRAAHCSQGAA